MFTRTRPQDGYDLLIIASHHSCNSVTLFKGVMQLKHILLLILLKQKHSVEAQHTAVLFGSACDTV